MKIIKRIVAVLWLSVLTGPSNVNAQDRDSLDIKIGQMILIGFPGQEVDEKVLDEVRAGKVGSIIIFEKNIPATNSFVALKKIVWTYQEASPIPLFVCIDQEGGRVNRLKDKYGFPRSITAEEMGKDPSLDSVRFYSEATAATLSGLGINVNFAPVVDLSTNPDNPIIAKVGRAFSPDADSVTLMAREVIKQHRRYDVVTSLKHFPGHGSSKHDTHLGIADVTTTWEEKELAPYHQLIDSGYVDAIMTSHIVNRKLDPDGHPGTLSDDIITGILRRRLGYNGVVFSDDMQMQAITKHYGLDEAIRMAITAGVDIMTFSNNILGSDNRTVDAVHSIVRNLVKQGIISEKRIDESFNRIMKLKGTLGNENRRSADKRALSKTRKELEAAKATLDEYKDVIEKARRKKEKRNRKKKP